MRRSILILVIFLIAITQLQAQTIKVTDKSTGKPIANVSVINFSETKTTISNKLGIVDLIGFSKNDTLVFHHTAFQTVIISIPELKEADYKLAMFPSVIHLKETVVSASRWEQKKEEVPMHIAHISNREIQLMEPQTAADMLGGTGQVFIQKSQMGGGSPMLRGFASNKVLIVVDGIRMNNPIYRHGNLQNVISVDPNLLQGSEVIFGPGSVIYGSDAIGGVMDFHTLDHQFSESDSLNFSGNALVRYNSGNQEKTGHFDINIAGEKWSSITSISASDFSDLQMGKNGVSSENFDQFTKDDVVLRYDDKDSVVPNYDPYLARLSGYSQLNILQKLAYNINDDKRLEYAFHYSSTSDVPRYDRLVQTSSGLPKYAQWYYGPQEWMMHALKYEDHKANAMYDEMKVQLAYQDYTESRHDRKLYSDMLRHRTENVQMLSLNSDFFKPLDAKNALFYGFEGTMSKIYSYGHQENIITKEEEMVAPRYPDNSDYSSAALYAVYRHLLNSKITINAGVRMNAVYAFAPFSSTFYDFPYHKIEMTGLAPNALAGLVYNPSKTWQMNLNFSTGYRAPNIDDIGKVFDSEPGAVVVPNENLQPEYAYNLDFSTSKTIEDMIRIDAGAFYTVLTNAMLRDDYQFDGNDSIMYDGEMAAVQAIQNVGRVDVYGAFAGIYADLYRNISFKSQINYTAGADQDGNPYRHVPPVFGQTHLLLNFGNVKIDAYAVYNGEISPDKLSPEEHGKAHMYLSNADYAAEQATLPESERFNEEGLYSPAWMTLNFKLNYAMNENLYISVAGENLTDQLYRPYSSGIPAMGRRVMLSLRANF
jgi:hemoglobin/transferrin/lactoferrin receptor protein